MVIGNLPPGIENKTGLYCISTKSPNTHHSKVIKIGMAQHFKHRLDNYHTYLSDGFYMYKLNKNKHITPPFKQSCRYHQWSYNMGLYGNIIYKGGLQHTMFQAVLSHFLKSQGYIRGELLHTMFQAVLSHFLKSQGHYCARQTNMHA